MAYLETSAPTAKFMLDFSEVLHIEHKKISRFSFLCSGNQENERLAIMLIRSHSLQSSSCIYQYSVIYTCEGWTLQILMLFTTLESFRYGREKLKL